MSTDRLASAAVCLGCGCTCDDITLCIRSGRIVEARNACSLGVAWFGDGRVPGEARVTGRASSVADALDAAARLLAGAARPLVYLAPDLSCEAQREGIALADALRATLDSVTSATAMPSLLAAQERGRAGATLGEIRHRADVLVFWGIDPALRYPRYWTRYAPGPPGLHVPAGRRSRTVVAVDVGKWRGPDDADLRVRVSPEEEVATLTVLRAIVSGHAAPESFATQASVTSDATPVPVEVAQALATGATEQMEGVAREVKEDTGAATEHTATKSPGGASAADRIVAAEAAGGAPPGAVGRGPWVLARALAPTLLGGRYVVLVADGEPDSADAVSSHGAGDAHDPGRAEALIALSQALNGATRCALSTLRAGGNRSGADAAITWQTGYPAAVDFARGYPRFFPYDGSAGARLARGEVDAVLVLGSAALIPAGVLSMMARVPCAVIGPRASESPLADGDAVIDTAMAGIHDAGTAVRMDDVPLPLRASLGGPPSAVALARAVRERCTAARAREEPGT